MVTMFPLFGKKKLSSTTTPPQNTSDALRSDETKPAGSTPINPQNTPQGSSAGYRVGGVNAGVGYNTIPEQQKIPLSYGIVGYTRNATKIYTVPVAPTLALTVPQNTPVAPKIGSLIPKEYTKALHKSRTLKTVFLSIGIIALITLLRFSGVLAGEYGTLIYSLSLIPLGIVIFSTIWIGKWDPEPFFMRALAFIWGATGAVLLTLGLTALNDVLGIGATTQFGSVAIQAPILEEFSKSVFVLTIAFYFRKFMDGPIDAIIYVMLAAAGFAFTENIIYFAEAFNNAGAAALGLTFVLRGIFSPFAHALFTLPIAILVGRAVKKKQNNKKVFAHFLVGYIIAVFLHGLWNGSTLVIADMFLWIIFYLLIQLPLFVTAIIIVTWLRKNETTRTYRHLIEYAWNGWFTNEEVQSLGTWEGRKHLTKWSKNVGQEAMFLTNKITKEVVDLGNLKESMHIEGNNSNNMRDEQILLQKIIEDKKLLTGFYK